MQAEGLFGYRDGHGEGDPEEGQQSNGNHQHSSSGDSTFRATCPTWVPGEMGC